MKKRKLSPAATLAIGIGATLVLALAGWFLLVSPQRSRSADLDEQIAAVDKEILEARLAAQQAEDAQPLRVADLFRLTKAMPSDSDMAGVLLELSRIASETGIVFEQIVPLPTVAAGSFQAQPTELVFVGDFYSLSDFLYRLRKLVSVQHGRLLATGRLFSVDKLQFVEADEGFPRIKAVLSVSALLYGATGGSPTPAEASSSGSSTASTSTETTPATTDPPPTAGSAAGAP